jgi:processive 1,2-diacylglycerol beta-glucosyltransferase
VVTRRALFLSGSFGKGHDTLAEACAEALAPFGVQSTVVDCMPMLGRGLGGIGSRVFRSLLSWPPAYDAFHFSQLRSEGPLGRFSDRAAVKALMPNLRKEIAAHDPDLVVSVFATGAAGAAELKHERPDITTVVFMTDSFAHRIWVHEGTDLYLVTSDLAAASVRRYEPAASVTVVEAPVRQPFLTPPSMAEARAALGVDPAARCVLVMSGGWGIGPVAEITRALASAGYAVLAVAGSNDVLAGRLRAIAAQLPQVVPFGYTDDIAGLMAAADVVVTSSGDTCREARAIGRPMVLLDVVPGHGRENLMHEVEMGGAAICSPSARSVVGVVDWTFAQEAPPGAAGDPRGMAPRAARPGTGWSDGFVAALRGIGVELGAEL